ncbi:membrane protein [Clostridia bacterium]|nr:membrane protein [Clostridia bacterium]
MKKTEKIVLLGVLTAIVFVLQIVVAPIKLGTFAITLVLIPVVIGASLCGVYAGTWLGFVFGIAVLVSGDAAAFLQINTLATVFVVLAKGTLAGFASGLVYKLLAQKNKLAAVFSSAVVCPLINTGIFLLGSYLFFLDTIKEWAGGANATTFIFTVLIGANFFFELGANLIFAPAIAKIINIGFKTFSKKRA